MAEAVGGTPSAPTLETLRTKRAGLLQIAARHRLQGIRVFGSVARGEARPGSDVDLLVEPQGRCSLFDLIEFEDEAAALLGVKVDAHTFGDLHWTVKDRVLSEAVPV
ncbi:MAG: nucleotidyltransferase family protein [Thermoplasmatota archaeon]